VSGRPRTVGVLYPGEMGAAGSALLRERGATVVTTLAGRGEATAERAAAVGVTVVDSLAEVVRRSDVVISLVHPAAASEVAGAYCTLAHLAPRGAVYVDANSIGPEGAAEIARQVESAGVSFVDASINGLTGRLSTGGTLYLSGPRAGEVVDLFDGALRVRVLGAEAGRASAMKMLLGGLSKGLCALFAELALLAERQGMLPEMLEAVSRTYPGVAAVAERMLPTYPRHAGRRATEMSELESTAAAAGGEPVVIAAVRQVHDTLAGRWPGGAGAVPAEPEPQLEPLLRLLAARLNEPTRVV
jgi:3-hydroxyisobutyrate dehydrogenase-like beta-hydroxyacid dehydrogenase